MSYKRDYLSASALKAFATSPNHYIDYVTKAVDPTPAMIFGAAMHCHILEPNDFDIKFAVAPDVDRRTKQGKLDWAEFLESIDGQDVITSADFQLICRMEQALHNHPAAHELFETSTEYEQHIEGDIFGFPFRGIADGIGIGFIYDLKSTQDASPNGFERTAFNSMYHEQAYIYSQLLGLDCFYWVAMEKNSPYNVAVYRQSKEAAEKAAIRIENLVRQFIEWDGMPQSYSNDIIELNLPRWA